MKKLLIAALSIVSVYMAYSFADSSGHSPWVDSSGHSSWSVENHSGLKVYAAQYRPIVDSDPDSTHIGWIEFHPTKDGTVSKSVRHDVSSNNEIAIKIDFGNRIKVFPAPHHNVKIKYDFSRPEGQALYVENW